MLCVKLGTIVVVVTLLAGYSTLAARARVRYAVQEGQPTSTFVGDLLRDGNLTGGPRPVFQLRGRQRPSPLPFSVDRRSGVIRTAAVVDREGLCPGGQASSVDSETSECRVNFDVSVRTPRTTKTISVEVEVLDVNDNQPTFPDSQVTILLRLCQCQCQM